jgi:hypothetical protein
MKRTIFLSLPMKGREDEAIKNTIEGMIRIITAMYPNDELEFVENFSCILTDADIADCLKGVVKHQPLLYLGNAIRKMAKCDSIAVIDNRNCELYNYRGCYIEAEVARNYGLHFITVNDPDGSILLPDIKAKVEEERKQCPKEEVCGCCEGIE